MIGAVPCGISKVETSIPKVTYSCDLFLQSIYRSTQNGQHGHPIMSCMDHIHGIARMYVNNCNWWTHKDHLNHKYKVYNISYFLKLLKIFGFL